MFYLINTERRRVITWFNTLKEMYEFIGENQVVLDENTKIVQDLIKPTKEK